MKSIFLAGCLLFLAQGLFSQQYPEGIPAAGIGVNYRIHPGNTSQSEVFIVRSPVNHNVLFSACNTISFVPFFISEGIYVTTNGGSTWSGDDTCTGSPIGYHGGDPGITIDKNGTFILTRLGRSPFVGLYSHYSSDNGHTWSSQKVISTDDLERAALTTDANPASPYSGRTYAAWTKLSQPFPLMFSSTSDGAQTWSTPIQVNNPSTRSAGGDVSVGLNGKIYTCWAGVTESSPFKEIMVGFASSANGGTSWNVTENAFAVNGITGLLANKNNIRVNGLPALAIDTTSGSHRGWIYIVTGQKDLSPAGSDPDIILYRSTDGGVSWSSGIRVNQDALNNGKTQYFPNIYIDQFGAVDIIFYDDRNTTTDSTGVFLARSVDGGTTWREFEISDHHFKPAPIGGLGQGYQGDVIDITSTDTKLWPVWMDNFSGIYQIWTVPIDFSSVNGVDDNNPSPGSFLLKQNYPNPFSSHTRIAYRVPSPGFVSLKILDIFGNVVMEPLHELKAQGDYELEFDPSAAGIDNPLINGIYFYRLMLNDRVETRKMILIK
jgi:hypothetical protein